jgi:hypothetical protein
MADDIRIAQPDWNVEMVIINPADRNQYASLVSSVTTLPWLQDTADEAVWARWGRDKDELCIVDTQGGIVTVTNLGYANLEDARNRQSVFTTLLTVAKAVDIDADTLPDAWENHYFGSLASSGRDDSDGDGQNAFAEFAFGTDPNSTQGAAPTMNEPLLLSGSLPRLIITYRRRAGALLDYWLESSADFHEWDPLPARFVSTTGPQNLYDGTGMAEARAAIQMDASLGLARFMRLRARPRE